MIGKAVAYLTDPMCLGTAFVAGLALVTVPGPAGVVVGLIAGLVMLLGWLAFARLDEQRAAGPSDKAGWKVRASTPRLRRNLLARAP